MKQTGMAMVEALVAATLLGLGLLGATRLTTYALDAAWRTRQEVQAHTLVAETLECAMARMEPCPAAVQRQHLGITYTVQLQRTPVDASLTDVQAQVRWSGTGSTQLRTLVGQTRISALPDWVGVSSP